MDVPFRKVGRGRKWCLDCETEYEGNYFTSHDGTPRGKLDDEGRVIGSCDPCIDKWERAMAAKGNIAQPAPRDKVQSQVPIDLEYPGEPKE